MSFPRSGSVTCAALLALTLAASGAGGAPAESKDPLTAEVERWVAYLKGNTATDEMWTQVKEASEPVLGRTETALRDGRRLLALQRLAVARVNLAASAYLGERTPEQRSDPAGFEAEWARLGKVLRGDLGAIPPGAFDGVQPAAVRALGEAALPQVRVYYEASLEYGRNTMPDSGLFYLGAAQAQRDFAVFCRSLAAPSPRRAPPLRALGPEIESLQHDFLAAYRPPISIDKHLEFILANSALNEARELDGAGRLLGITLSLARVAGPDDFDRALARAKRDGAAGIIATNDGVTWRHRKPLVQLALKHRLPAIYWAREYVDDGGLMTYSASVAELRRRAATYVDKILKGAKPADLPVEQPTTFELVINLKAARALGLTIPQSLLQRADQVIE